MPGEGVRVLIWAVAGEREGLGHVVRMDALCAELGRVGAHVRFLVTGRAPSFVKGPIEEASPEDTLATVEAWRPRVVVADLRDTWRDAGALRRAVPRLACVVDDLAHVPTDAHPDVVIHPNLVLDGSPPPAARLLAGAPYLLLRDQFRAVAARAHAPTIGRALVAFGGTDPTGLTERALSLLRDRHVETTPLGVRYQRVSDVAGAMLRSDVGLLAGGTLLYEAAACGLPSLIVSRHPQEAREADEFARRGAAIHLGPEGSFTPAALDRALASLAGREERAAMADSARALVDGRGCERVARELLSLAKEAA